MDLVGLDSNAFSLIGHFQRNARRQGWSQEDISKVLTECKSGNYDHLLNTLMNHTECPVIDADECDDWEELE